MIFIFLTSGLFLGWSLGANDAANVFGTAVGTRMLRFKTAALIAGVFVVIGAVVGGAGAAHTLGKLGAVNALAGSFMVAFGAAFTVFMMTKFKLPVSTSQAVVGSIIGWNFFSGTLTDYNTLSKIVSTWVLCPLLSAIIAIILYKFTKFFLTKIKLHLLWEDNLVRWGLIIVGAFGSYSLGANNIANVMGVFISSTPFTPIDVYGLFTLSGAQQLFFLGGLAIAIGIYTYSYKVMDTVGSGLMKLSPVTALVIVLSQAIVLFLFSSAQLENWLVSNGLPAIPLVPVSSSQAVIGAILGMGIAKGGKGIRFNVLGGISSGWVTTPIIACLITFIGLFFLQNVFSQQVSKKAEYQISKEVMHYLDMQQIKDEGLEKIQDKIYYNSIKLYSVLERNTSFKNDEILKVIEASKIDSLYIEPWNIALKVDKKWFTGGQLNALRNLSGKKYVYSWQLEIDLQSLSEEWKLKENTKKNKLYNKEIKAKLKYLFNIFKVQSEMNDD